MPRDDEEYRAKVAELTAVCARIQDKYDRRADVGEYAPLTDIARAILLMNEILRAGL